MPAEFLDIAMTPDVMDVQHEMGSDELWQSPHRQRRGERFGASEEAMIATRDSFYLATLSQTGWPYIQHRGGPVGFLHLLDETTTAMADFPVIASTSPPATCAAAIEPVCFDGLPAACRAENLRHRRGCGGGCRPAAAGAGGAGELSGPD